MKKGIGWCMLNYFIFDGLSSEQFGTYLGGAGKFEKTSREYTALQIEGHTGDLYIDKGRYKNIAVEYPIVIMDNMKENQHALFNMFMSKVGYKRLEDSFNSGYYMLAKFKSMTKIKLSNDLKSGSFNLSFDCNPKKFLKSGDNYIDISSPHTLFNSTMYPADPVILMTGTGQFTFNGDEYTLQANTSVTTIDCGLREVYEGTINRNDDFVRYDKMPSLVPGKNIITCGSGVSLKIAPKWWTL